MSAFNKLTIYFLSCSTYILDMFFLAKLCNLSSGTTEPVPNATCALPVFQPPHSRRAHTWWPRSCTPSASKRRSASTDWPSTWKWVYKQHFPAPQMRTDLWGQTTSLSILDFVVSSNRKQTGDFQNFGTESSMHSFTATFLALQKPEYWLSW